jgi:hypothetical protein
VSVETRPARSPTSLQDPKTLAIHPQTSQGEVKSGGGRWLIVGGSIAVVLVGLVIAMGYVAWVVNDQTATKPSNNSSTVVTNSNVAANTNNDTPGGKESDDKGLKWLDGVWEGKGYQSNPKSTWTIKLIVQNDSYVIEYPSLTCRGKWSLIEKETGKARFKEIITEGLSRCENNGTVLIEKVDDAQVSFKYSSPNTTSVTSTAVLRKRAQSAE